MQAPEWVELRMPSGKLVGKYDPHRGLLQVRVRGEVQTFDLAEIATKSQRDRIKADSI